MSNIGEEKEEASEEVPGPREPEKPAEREARRKYIKLAAFGLPESPYSTVKDLLRAMSKSGGAGTQLTNQQIADTAALSSRVVSGNNRFLISTGIANRSGNNVLLTEKGAQLALAVDYNDQEESSRAWRAIVAENDFLKKVLGALDIRGGMTADEFAQYTARTAGAPNEPEFIRGGKAVVDIFLEAGLVKEAESGKLVVTPEYRSLGTPGFVPEVAVVAATPEKTIGGTRIPSQGPAVIISINVSLSPDTTADEIAAMAAKIKELRDKVQ